MSTLEFREGFRTRPANYIKVEEYWEISSKDTERICEKLDYFLTKVLTDESYSRVCSQYPEDFEDSDALDRMLTVLWKTMSDLAPAGTVFGFFYDREYLGYWPPNKVK